jgi:transcription-repair coupling factor (superfamily II helicase)
MDLDLRKILSGIPDLTLSQAPEGLDVMMIGDVARACAGDLGNGLVLHIARDDARAAVVKEALGFFAPDVTVLNFPAWDCLPYDRVSPKPEISAERMACLAALAARSKGALPTVLIATVNAALQRVPTREAISSTSFSAHVGNVVDLDILMAFLARNGFSKAGTVMEPGDYAVRGGIVDVFPPGASEPVRLDFFGDTLDSVRSFDPETQRTTGQLALVTLVPVSEVPIDKASIQRFRQGYVEAFGAVRGEDPLYESVSAGRKYQGMEHWLPLFHETLETLFDFVGQALVTFDPLAENSRAERQEQIQDYYEARTNAPELSADSGFSAPLYNAVPPEGLFLNEAEWKEVLGRLRQRHITPFAEPENDKVISLGGKAGRSFAGERALEGANVFDAVTNHVLDLQEKRKRVIIATWTKGSRERMSGVLSEHGLDRLVPVDDYAGASALRKADVALSILSLETGFETSDLVVIGEQDILGDRLTRGKGKSRKAANFLREASSLTPGDLVVHIDHGIGRYQGLKTITVTGDPHECLALTYAGGDRLFLPVENIELLSRYGSDNENAQLDRLGGSGWQARKAKLKERIRDIADQLIKIAAERELKKAEVLIPGEGLYQEFCARFPYEETEDQSNAIDDVVEDLAKGRPMDRLICGDVGFGKTEVALRAAFTAAMSGVQVAIVCPTTLLSRQHYQTFIERFAGWPLKIRQLSRMVSTKDASAFKKEMAEGQADIVIGTHALLAKTIKFKNLGLLIIDEEQHFGVVHKERMKQLKSEIHVLTLTATPIPRTLQMALSGVRELSLIATPPVDRLAVRTYVTPFDPVVVREALLREHYRGGQSFIVCPRITDLREMDEFLNEYVPEVKGIVAHGQMASRQLEDIMSAYYDGKFDVLISTTIIESGLDIPRANTMIVHRSQMFGLSQLYQIRGRIGRSKTRAYAYLTYPAKRRLTDNAAKRLEVLQALDSLGAGFNIASHDLDIRGAGNLLGEEQSGQVKEVGLELYQDMLEEAVASLRSGETSVETDEAWSPQINVGTAVLIPEGYVPDLDVRLSLYRRLSEVVTREEIDAFASELIDRFGSLPEEVEMLLKIVEIKGACRSAGIEKLDVGPKGAIVSFRKNQFSNPEGLINYMSVYANKIRLRPDHKLVHTGVWDHADDRLAGAKQISKKLAEIAADVG